MRVHRNCCGLDVHKKIIAACLIREDSGGNSVTAKKKKRAQMLARALRKLTITPMNQLAPKPVV